MTVLSEENMLLRDFTYNIDPQAKTLHAHRFMNANNQTSPLNESGIQDQSLFVQKINELVAKVTKGKAGMT